MCFTMGDHKFDEDVGFEAPHGAAEQQRVMIEIVDDMPQATRPVTPPPSDSAIIPEFEDLSIANNSPSASSGNSFETNTGSSVEISADSSNNEMETVEYYLSQPNAETGGEDLHRLHIEQTPNYVDGNPMYTISSDLYKTTARFGPRMNYEHSPQFFIEHEFGSSNINGFPEPNSQQSSEFSDYVAAAAAFMQDRYPTGNGSGGPLISNYSNPAQGPGLELTANTLENSRTFVNRNGTICSFPAEMQPGAQIGRGTNDGILGPAPTMFPTDPSGRMENGTTYYGGNPLQQPPRTTQHQFQVQPQMYQSGGAPLVNVSGPGQSQLLILPGPPQIQTGHQPFYSYNPFGLPPQLPPVAVQTSNGLQYTSMAAHPYGRGNSSTRRAFPSQQPMYQVGPPAQPTFGVGFPQPRPTTPNPNRVQFSSIGAPFNIHLTSVPVQAPVQHVHPLQMQVQDFPPPPFILLPHPPAPLYSTGLQGQVQMHVPGPTLMMPPRYEYINPHGQQQQQQQMVDFMAGAPLMYYPSVETNNQNLESVNYNNNAEVYNVNAYADSDSKIQQDISTIGFRRYLDDMNMRGLAKYMVKENPQVAESSRTSTAESGSSTTCTSTSWSELMEDDDNNYEDSTDIDSPRSTSTTDSLELCKKEEIVAEKIKNKEVTAHSNCGEVVNKIINDMVDCGNTFFYHGKEFPYVATHWDERIVATAKLPHRQYSYYVPPTVQDDDFFGGQQYLWQLRMMAGFSRFYPHAWRIQALPDFEKRPNDWYNFTVTSKLRFCCRNCNRAWTSMRGKILFTIKFDSSKQRGNILMKIFGQVCTRDECDDPDFQTPTCYPEEILRVIWKLSEFVGCIYYNIPLSAQFHYDPDKAIRCGNPASPHRKELCQACQKGVCSRV